MMAEGENESAPGVKLLLRTFLDIQQLRASAYSLLHNGFADYLKTSSEVAFKAICSQVTRDFSECSRQVLELEARLRAPSIDRPDLASVLEAVQVQEKEKLHMTATLQVLRRAGRPSEREGKGHECLQGSSHDCSHIFGLKSEEGGYGGLEMAQLEAEYDAAYKEATMAVQDAVTAINEHMEEVRYEIEEQEQTRNEAPQTFKKLSLDN